MTTSRKIGALDMPLIRPHAKAVLSGVLVLTGLGLLWSSSRHAPPSLAAAEPAHVARAVEEPPPALSPDVPPDLTFTGDPSLEGLQRDFDRLSWATFVALNWPAGPDGEPDKTKVIGQDGDNPTVWQAWKETSDIFLPGGSRPSDWGTPRTPPDQWPQSCKDLFQKGCRLLVQIAKVPNVLGPAVQPFKTGPLIDQHGRYARFEILVNQPMFQNILDNQLYSIKGQKAVKKVVFPCGSKQTGEVGAILVKAAWKILTESEARSGRFHTSIAIVYTPASTDPPVEQKCERVEVGLVGMHIVHKTSGSPQWVWSTFEHVDNCPTDGEVPDRPQYNYFNKDAAGLKLNTPPPRPWDPNRVEPPDRRTQVLRMIPITAATKALNTQFQAALRAASKPDKPSVWTNYELVSTQWPTKPSKTCDVLAGAPVDRIGTPAPQFLGNSTLETYIQGKVPNVSSSCMECHANATTTQAVFSDFTYILEQAQ
jgi:hypothetical protein